MRPLLVASAIVWSLMLPSPVGAQTPGGAQQPPSIMGTDVKGLAPVSEEILRVVLPK
ncbi:MAG: hypothetical protein IH969_11070, partial [Candidatus Krumholzibacteriota bacterium]|nr:hypothetical protein [Candidatus Krumholzibacteriota bacterium]